MREPEPRTAFQRMSAAIATWEGGRTHLEVLEAGGGSLSHVRFATPHTVTVIDISPEQLERNTTATHKILGDLHDVPIAMAAYDAVVCFDVIEHLRDPGRVLAKLFAALRPGGIVVLAAPNPASLSGMITKYMPHWFHVAVMKYAFGDRTAGLPGHGPFPTHFHEDIGIERLQHAVERAGLEVLFREAYESERRAYLRAQSPLLGRLFDLAIRVGNSITAASLENSDMFLIARRGAADRERAPQV